MNVQFSGNLLVCLLFAFVINAFQSCTPKKETGILDAPLETKEQVDAAIKKLESILGEPLNSKADTSRIIKHIGEGVLHLHLNAKIPVLSEYFPKSLKNIPESILLALIKTDELSEEAKVSTLLLQHHSSDKVRSEASRLKLNKALLAESSPNQDVPIPDKGYSVTTENTLDFETKESFAEFMDSFVNQSDSSMDKWEQSIGFISMRTTMEGLKKHPEANHLAIDSSRIDDTWFESVLNPEGKLIIANVLYQLDVAADIMTITELEKDSTYRIQLDNKSAAGNNCPGRKYEPDRIIPHPSIPGANYIIVGKKWRSFYLSWGSVGASTTIYLGSNGSYQTESVPEVLLLIDQWHILQYRKCNSSDSYTAITNSSRSESNTWKSKKVWQSYAFKRVDVPIYQRVHHWFIGPLNANYWNQDVHTDNW